jgi:hypothetical protein
VPCGTGEHIARPEIAVQRGVPLARDRAGEPDLFARARAAGATTSR